MEKALEDPAVKAAFDALNKRVRDAEHEASTATGEASDARREASAANEDAKAARELWSVWPTILDEAASWKLAVVTSTSRSSPDPVEWYCSALMDSQAYAAL